MNVSIDLSKSVFNPVFIPYLEDYSRTQIIFGGSSSGKSKFCAQRAVYDILKGGRNYLVCRAIATTLKKSVFNEIMKVIIEWDVKHLFHILKSEMVITCSNGHQILFSGLDDMEKVKSITPLKGSITDIWIEESTEVKKNDITELYKRQRGGSDKTPKRMILTFNPILKSHHIFRRFFAPVGWDDDQTTYKAPDLSILKVWYIHNEFLSQGDIYDLENEQDEYYFQVYTLGNWGVLGNVIFKNWKVRDLSKMVNQFDSWRVGLDFGYSSDPAAVVVSHYDRKKKTIFIFKELYEWELTNDVLAIEITKLVGNEYIVADSSEPKSIQELTNYGVNVAGAKKGKDSVGFGIQWLKQQTIIIDSNCIYTQNEFQKYHWKEDRWGESLPVPVDKDNHIIDALRYSYEDESLGMPAFL